MKYYRCEVGPHYGPKDWDEFCWLDAFLCSGCGIDFAVLNNGPKLNDKLCGRRYGNVVMVAHMCGCERTRFNLVLLDDQDYIAAHYTVSERELEMYWPRIAEFYVGDDDWNWDDDDYDPVAEEREYWPEFIRRYHHKLNELRP
jgi:hypothetical protein